MEISAIAVVTRTSNSSTLDNNFLIDWGFRFPVQVYNTDILYLNFRKTNFMIIQNVTFRIT